MSLVLLALALLLGLLLVPLGFPGLWVMVAAAWGYASVPGSRLGSRTVIALAAAALVAEGLELVLAGRFARRYGGTRRAGWGAIIGGLIGAIVGVPVPIIGSMIGAFVGAFAGAWVAERTQNPDVGAVTKVATGALLGRAAAVASKVAIGLAMIVWVAFAVFLPR